MEQKKVAILMSTYNGEKYVETQLNSILNQTYKNIEIYVRDDGSKDNTPQILKKYSDSKKINFIQGENKGFIKSFLELLTYCDNAEYYAFSDQDDEWFEDKIERAVKQIEEKNSDKPVLYFANYDYYDTNMNFIKHSKNHKNGPSFRNSIVDCISLGINSILNRKARDLIIKNIPENSCGHDWWSYMVCSGMGDVIYDKSYTLKYRRHNSNVSADATNFIKFQIWRIKKFFINNYFNNVKQQAIEYEKLYKDKLSKKDQKVLNLFTSKNYNVRKQLTKVFYPKMFRQKMIDEIMLRFIFLIGKL